MKADDLTIDVTAKLTVSDETANRCLRLLEMWADDNPDKTIFEDGKSNRTSYRIILRKDSERLRQEKLFRIRDEESAKREKKEEQAVE